MWACAGMISFLGVRWWEYILIQISWYLVTGLAMPIWVAEVMRLMPAPQGKTGRVKRRCVCGGGCPHIGARRNHSLGTSKRDVKRTVSTRGENKREPWSETLGRRRRSPEPKHVSADWTSVCSDLLRLLHDTANHVKFSKNILHSIKFCNHERQWSIYSLRHHCFGWQNALFSQQFSLTGYCFPIKYLLNICLT